MRRLRAALLLAAAGCATASSTQQAQAPAAAPVASTAQAEASPSLEQLKADALEARKAGDSRRIQSLYREIARREPQNGEALAFAGMATIQLGQKHEGMAELERGLALTDSGPARYVLGLMYLSEQSPQRALPHLERAVGLMPEAVRAWDSLAQAYAQLGRLDDAFAAAERVKALAPDAPQTEVLLMALASMDGVMRVSPEAARHFTEGVGHAGQGRMGEARAAFEAALRLAPDFADCHYNLGVVLAQQGDTARAEREYRAAIPGFGPRQAVLQADARNNLAFLLVSRGVKGAEPVALVRAAIATRGERPSYLDTLARACDASGDTACAVETFRKLLAAKDALPPEVRVHAEARLEALAP